MVPPARGLAQIHAAHDPLEGVTADGMITTGARRNRISQQFLPVLEKAVEQVQALGADHSLYVYGSVATGMARAGSSDVDLVTIGVEPLAATRLGSELSAQFALLCRGVELGPAQLQDYGGRGDEAYGNRAFLRHYCVCLTGPDIARGWPDFPADKAAARGFNGDIGECAERWRRELAGAPHPALLARRIARKTLLAVSGLVSIHDAIWTTDRVSSALRWGIVGPHLAGTLDQLIEWGSGASTRPSPSQIQAMLNGTVADVVEEFRICIGLCSEL